MRVTSIRALTAVAVVGMGLVMGAWGQQETAASDGKQSCAVRAGAPSAGQESLYKGQYEEAARMFQAMPASSEATAGLVRAEVGERKLDDALALIQKESAAHPNDALLLDVLGEVRFRRGELDEAALAFNQSVKLDPCLARTHYDIGRYMNLNGLYASGQRQLDQAHVLAPDDSMIKRVWMGTQQVPLTPEQRIAALQAREANPATTDEQKAEIENTIKAIQAREKGDCELAQPMETAKIPLTAVDPSVNGMRLSRGSGVDVLLNGKRRRFVLDTGASGILITREAAKALGLTPEAESKIFGFGDNGARGRMLAHVDDVKIGGLEFHNCMVQVLEDKNTFGTDGFMGADVFRSFVVTLDFPGQEMRLSPLPKRPDEAEQTVSLGTSGSGEGEGVAIAQRQRDRYIAPEMRDWTKIFRSGHQLIFETSIGNVPRKLFIMDSGASETLISPNAAREVTRVSSDSDHRVKGFSGEVKNVLGTERIAIQFAHVRQETSGLTAIDLSNFSRSAGVEISGFIGYPILRELVVQIDYRDNLVHVTYTPHIEPGSR